MISPHCANVPSKAESWHPIPNNPKKEMLLGEAGQLSYRRVTSVQEVSKQGQKDLEKEVIKGPRPLVLLS